MCGFTGFWQMLPTMDTPTMHDVGKRMAEKIAFRGPDDYGVWGDNPRHPVLAHRRLAIVDVSAQGHQPMLSPSTRYVIAFNGEVYNAPRLRPSLENAGYVFKGHSDTEIMLAAIEHYGLENALQHFIGMFAFALFDRRDEKLYLVRDRMGVKPLYYGILESNLHNHPFPLSQNTLKDTWETQWPLFFGSQISSFSTHPSWPKNPQLHEAALREYFVYNYLPRDTCAFKGFQKVPPGTIVAFSKNQQGHFERRIMRYWSLGSAYKTAQTRALTPSKDDVHTLLRDAVDLRMLSDVPLGAFLSGGIDSSLVVALMQEKRATPIKTFTIGFSDNAFDESFYAEKVAHILGTEHETFYLPSHDALSIIPNLPISFDEPFGDASMLPTFLVSQMARNHVTVSLSGDGGDELFGGYTRHQTCIPLWHTIKHLPLSLRRFLAPCIHHLSHPRYEGLLRRILLKKISHPGEKLKKLSSYMTAQSLKDLFHATYCHINRKNIDSLHFNEMWDYFAALQPDPLTHLQLCDSFMYLEGDILTKVDRATMAHSLEAREPLLDHRLVEMAFALPTQDKIQQGHGKIMLRRILEEYLPKTLIDRPKQGFGIPLAKWLRGPLKSWASDLLNDPTLYEHTPFSHKEIQSYRTRHMSYHNDYSTILWNLLMYQQWRQHLKHPQP